MNPYAIENLFGIEGFHIAWYGIIIATSVLLGVMLSVHQARRKDLHPDIIIDFTLASIPIALIGARLYYVLFQWDSYRGNILKIIDIRAGGLAIYGGVIGGILAAALFCKVKRFPILTLLDLIVPGMLLGQAIGRWGNSVNQEAYGNVVLNPSMQFFPIAVYIDELMQWRQATFFYESMWNTVLLCLVLVLSRSKPVDGLLLAVYFIGYGIGRFFIEGLRADSLYIIPGGRASQVFSLVLAVFGVVLLILIGRGVINRHNH